MKGEYCECPKKPGGILEIQGELRDMIHAGCGKKIGPMPLEAHPILCGCGHTNVGACSFCHGALQEENKRLREALELAKGEIQALSCCQQPYQPNMDKINAALGGK